MGHRRVWQLLSFLLSSVLKRPSVWVGLITAIAYYDQDALQGELIYDDKGSIKNHPVVTGQADNINQVWKLDFWGTPLSEPQSHKSFRPLVTLSFRYNWQRAKKNPLGHEGRDEIYTIEFHFVNFVLHIVDTILAVEVSKYVFFPIEGQIITGLIFGLHPVHVEAVANITSRSELLRSFFALLAIWSYACHINTIIIEPTTNINSDNRNNNTTNIISPPSSSSSTTVTTFLCIYVLPWICMILSVLCKEQGATTLVTCVLYEFIQYHGNVQEFLTKLLWWNKRDSPKAWKFLGRIVILAIQSLLVVLWRIWMNGETSPDFVYEQNPAGFAPDRFTRIFSISWVHVLYIWDVIYPAYLCPDWSGLSIDLIESISDPRIVGVLALWMLAGSFLLSLVRGNTNSEHRRVLMLAFFAFTFSPFLLSSNLLVVVGLMKADRVIYLPLLGLAMMEAWLFTSIVGRRNTPTRRMVSDQRIIAHSLIMLQFLYFCVRLHERNVAWSGPVQLWVSAYQVNPRSRHTIYNCGYELSLVKRYAESEQVLRPIAHPSVEGPENTFVYATVLYSMKRCDEALELIEAAYQVIEERRQNPDLRNTPSVLARNKSNLMVVEAYCTDDMQLAAQRFYNAVQEDPTNQYAIDHATKRFEQMEAFKKSMMMQQQQQQQRLQNRM